MYLTGLRSRLFNSAKLLLLVVILCSNQASGAEPVPNISNQIPSRASFSFKEIRDGIPNPLVDGYDCQTLDTFQNNKSVMNIAATAAEGEASKSKYHLVLQR